MNDLYLPLSLPLTANPGINEETCGCRPTELLSLYTLHQSLLFTHTECGQNNETLQTDSLDKHHQQLTNPTCLCLQQTCENDCETVGKVGRLLFQHFQQLILVLFSSIKNKVTYWLCNGLSHMSALFLYMWVFIFDLMVHRNVIYTGL